MKRIPLWSLATVPGVLAILCGAAFSGEGKDTVQVPNGLAFSEFKGYERWEIIGLSHGGERLAVIVGNPAMIDAYKAGIPDNGKPFPDGAKMAKASRVPSISAGEAAALAVSVGAIFLVWHRLSPGKS